VVSVSGPSGVDDEFGSLFGIIRAIIPAPIAASIEIVLDNAIAGRHARVAAAEGRQ
jgi:hypothetical protein